MTRSRKILALSVAAAVWMLSGCTWNPDADSIGGDDREILRALIAISCKVGVDNIVVSDRPALPRDSGRHDIDHRNIQFGIDVDRRLAHEARWKRRQVCPTVKVVDDSALAAALAQESKTAPTWDHFSAVFGGAHTLMRISLPVYSSDGIHAVVYTESTCPFRCGTGFYHELKKQFGEWRIEQSRSAWTS
jgi:hypothetical protein